MFGSVGLPASKWGLVRLPNPQAAFFKLACAPSLAERVIPSYLSGLGGCLGADLSETKGSASPSGADPRHAGERCERRERLVRLARMDSLLSSCFDVHSGAQSSPHLANWPLQAVTLGLRPRCHQHDILLTAINVEHLPVQLYMVSPHTATYQHGSRSRSSRPFEIHRCMRQGSSETFVSKSVKHRVANGPASRAFSFVGTPFVERRFSLRGGVMAGGAS